MLSYETVEPRTLELLKSLMQEPAFNDMRLVGGTALALQYGHASYCESSSFRGTPNTIVLTDEQYEQLGKTLEFRNGQLVEKTEEA